MNPRPLAEENLPIRRKPSPRSGAAHGSASWFDNLEPSEIHTLYIIMDVFKSLSKLRRTIGHTVVGQHPDEINPRGATWMHERQNWENEVECLRKRVAELEARPNADLSGVKGKL